MIGVKDVVGLSCRLRAAVPLRSNAARKLLASDTLLVASAWTRTKYLQTNRIALSLHHTPEEIDSRSLNLPGDRTAINSQPVHIKRT